MGLMSISRAEWQAWCRQIKEHGTIRLFKSCNPIYQDDEQLRDFVYVKDACRVILWLLKNPEVSGLFNVGTGRAQSFRELAEAVFHALLRCRSICRKSISILRKQRWTSCKVSVTESLLWMWKRAWWIMYRTIYINLLKFIERSIAEGIMDGR